MAILLATHVTGSMDISQWARASQGFTGSLFGTASWATSASWAPGASVSNSSSWASSSIYSNNAVSASWASSSISSSYPFVGSSNIASFGTGVTRLGLGTSDPKAVLHVQGVISSSAVSSSVLRIVYGFSPSWYGVISEPAGNLDYNAIGGGAFHTWRISSVERMRLVGSSLCINTISASQALNVNGSAAISGSLWVSTINNLEAISSDLTINASDFILLDAATSVLVDSAVLPYVDNSYDLGSTAYYWKDLYLYNRLVTPSSANFPVLIGYNAGSSVAADKLTGSVIIGFDAGSHASDLRNCVKVGRSVGTAVGHLGLQSVQIGHQAGLACKTASYGVHIGHYAAGNAVDNSWATYIGYFAGANLTDGKYSVAIGHSVASVAGYMPNTVALGFQAAQSAISASNSILIGSGVSYIATSSVGSTIVGFQAGLNNAVTDGATMLGYQAGYNSISSSRNILLGYQAGYSLERNNSLVIDSQATSVSSSAFIYGELDTKRLYFNTDCYISQSKMLYGTSSRAITASYADAALSASYSVTTSYYNYYDVTIYKESSSYASSSTYSQFSVSSSWSSASLSASWAPAGSTLSTSSLYPITSSWSVDAETASYLRVPTGSGAWSVYVDTVGDLVFVYA